MAETAKDPPRQRQRSPHIGAFVLETLTVGMYGEPRHTLREYVQNSFDSIRSAQRTKYLAGRGRVDINVAADAITIRDNGLGVPADSAWNTLTSVGASKKDRQRDAGFRGIGRLAGMAYCDVLIFQTTFPGETVRTTIRFDCKELQAAMNPDEGGDMELATLLADAITFEQDDALAEEHFFEVTLSGLADAPETLTDADKIHDYLSETVPVEFSPEWGWRLQIEEGYKSYFGNAIETIDVFVTANGSITHVYKPYGDTYKFSRGEVGLETIDFYSGENNSYWGWVGRLSDSGAVTDWKTRGLRIRARNIQVDGTEIFENLFTQIKPSYGRFSAYYVGEIHIDPESVIPNARRDGFEETKIWISVKSSLITNICEPLAREAYEASKKSQVDVGSVVTDIEQLIQQSQRLVQNQRTSYDQIVNLMISARRLRRRAAAALKIVGDLDDTAIDLGEPQVQSNFLQEAAKNVETVENQARMLIGRFLDEDDRITALKCRLREEILRELLDVVNLFVDPGTYQKIRRRLTII
jgi:Histidine kinase-, DNA gyrase B-, and HSP90-like ATPase